MLAGSEKRSYNAMRKILNSTWTALHSAPGAAVVLVLLAVTQLSLNPSFMVGSGRA